MSTTKHSKKTVTSDNWLCNLICFGHTCSEEVDQVEDFRNYLTQYNRTLVLRSNMQLTIKYFGLKQIWIKYKRFKANQD